jgi:hypothetical protein
MIDFILYTIVAVLIFAGLSWFISLLRGDERSLIGTDPYLQMSIPQRILTIIAAGVLVTLFNVMKDVLVHRKASWQDAILDGIGMAMLFALLLFILFPIASRRAAARRERSRDDTFPNE